MLKKIYLTTSGAWSWTVPSDWNNTNNSIECIGGGGNGSQTTWWWDRGGWWWAYSKKNNLSLTPGSSVDYNVGAAWYHDITAGDSWFVSTATVLAKAGNNGTSWGGDGTGGLATGGVWDVKYSGGTGWGRSPGSTRGGWGWWAAGLNGAWVNGQTAPDDFTWGAGGNGDNWYGWAWAAYGSSDYTSYPGGNGTEWDATHGSGGWWCGGSSNDKIWWWSGGLYGAGGGSAYVARSDATHGAQGIIVISYESIAGPFPTFFRV